MRHVEVVASRLGLESRRPVSRDAVAEAAVGAPELAVGSGFLRQLAVMPDTVDQNTHQAASPRASAAAFRIASMFARYVSGRPP